MRTIIFSFALLATFHQLCAQQSSITGTVTVFNSQFETGKQEYVANAQVEEDYGKSQATTTATNGTFRLPLVGIQAQEKVFYSVKKVGYEVVNADALQVVAGQAEPQRVFMAPEGKIAENKLKYYRINREAAEKALTEKLNRLEKEIIAAQSDQTRLKQLQAEYGSLQAQFEKIEETARELAERYARTNLDDVSADYQRAFRCFQRGQLDSALLIFKTIDLEANAANIISEQNRNADLAAEYARRDSEKNKRKQETNDALRFKAELHQTRFEFEKTVETYELLLRLDSTNVYNLSDFAEFLMKQNLHKQAIDYFKKCLVLVKTEDRRAGLFNNLGICYKNLNRPDEAEKNYLLAFATFEQLAKDNPAQFEPDLAKTANNLGNFYTIHHRPDEAEKNYLRAFEIYKRLAEKHPEQFKPVWASVANNFGAFYYHNNRPDEAEQKYLLAFEITERLVKSDSAQFEPHLALTANNLALFYKVNNRPGEAEQKYLLALKIQERLAKLNPARFEPDLAKTANNLGYFYHDNNRPAEAEKNYLLASIIYERLAKSDPAQFEQYLALMANNLGKFYYDNHRLTEAQEKQLMAIKIYERLAQDNPAHFEPFLALSAANFGNFFKDKDTVESEKRYLQAWEIYKRLAESNPMQFNQQLAMTANVLGSFYQDNHRLAEAQEKHLLAIKIYKQLVEDNPAQFEPFLAVSARNLGNLYKDTYRPLEAKEKYLQSLEIYERLVKDNPAQFEPGLATTINSLGVFYLSQNQTTDAIAMWERSLLIYRKMAIINPAQYDLEVARALILLGVGYSSSIFHSHYVSNGQSEFREAKQLILKYSDVPLSQKLLGIINKVLKD